MSPDDSGSVTHWIGALRGGELDAAQPLWERYFARLVRLAQGRLRTWRRPGAAEDEEDAVLSAFDSFCRAATQGRFPRLDDRDDLWRLLVAITERKVIDQMRRVRRPETWRRQGPNRGRPRRRRTRRQAVRPR